MQKKIVARKVGKQFIPEPVLLLSLNHSETCAIFIFQIHALKEHVHVHRHNDSYTCPHCSKVRRNETILLSSVYQPLKNCGTFETLLTV